MTKTEQLYEGKAKKVWATEDPDIVIVGNKQTFVTAKRRALS